MNEFSEGKQVWVQEAKIYVRLLPKKSTQYCLKKKSKNQSQVYYNLDM